jgi:hypothetical protein
MLCCVLLRIKHGIALWWKRQILTGKDEQAVVGLIPSNLKKNYLMMMTDKNCSDLVDLL